MIFLIFDEEIVKEGDDMSAMAELMRAFGFKKTFPNNAAALDHFLGYNHSLATRKLSPFLALGPPTRQTHHGREEPLVTFRPGQKLKARVENVEPNE